MNINSSTSPLRYPTVKFFQHYGHFADYRSVERRREFWLFFLFSLLLFSLNYAMFYTLNIAKVEASWVEMVSFILTALYYFILAMGFLQVLEYSKAMRHGTARSLYPLTALCVIVLIGGQTMVAGYPTSKVVVPVGLFVNFFTIASLISAQLRRYRSIAMPAMVFWVLFLMRAFAYYFLINALISGREISGTTVYLLVAGALAAVLNFLLLMKKTRLENNPLLPEPLIEEHSSSKSTRLSPKLDRRALNRDKAKVANKGNKGKKGKKSKKS